MTNLRGNRVLYHPTPANSGGDDSPGYFANPDLYIVIGKPVAKSIYRLI